MRTVFTGLYSVWDVTHGVFSQQVVFSVALAAVDGPQSAEQRPPA